MQHGIQAQHHNLKIEGKIKYVASSTINNHLRIAHPVTQSTPAMIHAMTPGSVLIVVLTRAWHLGQVISWESGPNGLVWPTY